MLDLGKTFRTSKEAENEGIWRDIGGGARIKIGRVGSDRYKEAFARFSKPYKTAIRTGTLADDVAEDLLIDAMVDAVLLDWEGLVIDGEELSYSKVNAKNVLYEFKDFRDLVTSMASELETFRVQETEEAVKNSDPS